MRADLKSLLRTLSSSEQCLDDPVVSTEVANCIQLGTDTVAIISRAEFETENGFEIRQDDSGALSAKRGTSGAPA